MSRGMQTERPIYFCWACNTLSLTANGQQCRSSIAGQRRTHRSKACDAQPVDEQLVRDWQASAPYYYSRRLDVEANGWSAALELARADAHCGPKEALRAEECVATAVGTPPAEAEKLYFCRQCEHIRLQPTAYCSCKASWKCDLVPVAPSLTQSTTSSSSTPRYYSTRTGLTQKGWTGAIALALLDHRYHKRGGI